MRIRCRLLSRNIRNTTIIIQEGENFDLQKINLDKEDENVFLEVYVADKLKGFTRNAIRVIPGGGYGGVCSDREGEPIAMAFMPYGYNAFVLHYSVRENSKKIFPAQLIQASMAMKHIKDHAEEYNINPEKVFVTGFSAGGHLTASLGTMWDKKEIYEAIDMPYGYNKPAGIMPVYPVISGVEGVAHEGSIYNLCGTETPTEEQRKMVSIEKHVTEKASPAYIVHTSNDQAVHVKNSLDLAGAYADAGLPFELHIYPDGPHGMALGNSITECGVKKYNNPCFAKWVENAVMWAENI